jgi:AcrR family transcriptional regulator
MAKPEIKSIIINAATQYFSKFGFYKTTMDEIAKHIHKAKGVLYYHYNSKEELFNEVLKQELDIVKSELQKVVNSDEDALTVLKNYFFKRLELLHESVNYHETLKADFFEKYHFVEEVREDFATFERNNFYQMLKKGEEEGVLQFNNIDSTVNMLLMLVNSMEVPLFLQNKYSEYIHTIKELAEFLVKGLKS